MSGWQKAIDVLGKIVKITQQSNDAELLSLITELQKQLDDIKTENDTIRQELKELKDCKAIDEKLVIRENAYWLDSAPETRRGPFCRKCWDDERKLISLDIRSDGHQSCSKCNGEYPTEASREAGERAIRERNARIKQKQDRLGGGRSGRNTRGPY